VEGFDRKLHKLAHIFFVIGCELFGFEIDLLTTNRVAEPMILNFNLSGDSLQSSLVEGIASHRKPAIAFDSCYAFVSPFQT